MMGSLFMIFALILVLGGGGYAIWMVLSEGPTDAAEETQSDADTSKAGLNPIEKAKAAIAKIPFLQTEEVVNEGTTSEAASPPAGITLPTEPAPKPDTTVAPTVNLASNTGEIDNSLTSSVTDFLADLHIGGVRSGSNARIMLNGESYGIGDVVDSQTELHFIGTQAGKLLFRDKNGIVYAKTF